MNGVRVAFLCGGGDEPACPATEGTATGVIDAADIIGPAGQGIEPRAFEEFVAAIRASFTYANVHSTPRCPYGEIRGQIRGEDDDHDGSYRTAAASSPTRPRRFLLAEVVTGNMLEPGAEPAYDRCHAGLQRELAGCRSDQEWRPERRVEGSNDFGRAADVQDDHTTLPVKTRRADPRDPQRTRRLKHQGCISRGAFLAWILEHARM